MGHPPTPGGPLMSPWSTLIVAIALVPVVLALAEILARAWLALRGDYFVWSPHARTLQVLDRESLPALPPLARFEVNRDGERGDPPPRDGWETYRVLVLGASSTECRFLDQRSTWPAVAQRFLSHPMNLELLRARRAHVGNLGRSLATCRDLNLILERVLPRYERLDAVVLMVGAGDVVHWLSERAPSKIEAGPVDPDEVFDEHPEGPFGWSADTLALRRIASSWRRRFLRSFAVHAGAGQGIGRARRLRAQAGEIIETLPDPAPLLDHLDESFRELIARAQSKARTVIVVRPCWVREGLGEQYREHGWMFAAGDLRAEDVRT